MNDFRPVRTEPGAVDQSARRRASSFDAFETTFVGRTVGQLWSDYKRSTDASFQRVEPLLVPICLCGALGMPLYYVIWTELFPQPYENLSLRLGGGLLCLFLASNLFWPKQARRLLPLAWHLCLLFCISFFFTFMVLMNDGSAVWLVTWLCGFFMLVVMVNWVNLLALLVAGIPGALVAYEAMARTTTYDWVPEQIPVFLFALIAGTLSSYRRGLVQQERFVGFATVGRNLARELNGPLRSMVTAAIGLKQHFPVIAASLAARVGDDGAIPADHLKTLEEAPVRIQNDLQRMSAIVQMLASISEDVDPRALPLANVSIGECVRQALRRYPFASDGERRILKWRADEEFAFAGHQELMVRAVLSVIKAMMLSILQHGRGQIDVVATRGTSRHVLTLVLTGIRIPSRLLPQVFDAPSFLEAGSGTGPGLFFAKRAVEAFGGELSVRNDADTRFEFRLPAAP